MSYYRMLMITHADMLSAGNQTMAETIRGYLRAGFQVLMLTSAPEHSANRVPADKVIPAEHIPNFSQVRFQLRLYGVDRVWRLAQRAMPMSVVRRVNRSSTRIPLAEGNVAFTECQFSRSLKETLAWVAFQQQAYRVAMDIARDFKPDVIYGYEIFGSRVAARLGRKLGVPCVSRFQGTVMYGALQRRYLRLKMLRHLWGLRAPCDLVIMANDGTRGREVLRKLGVPEDRIRFWLNGVQALIPPSAEEREAARRFLEAKLSIGSRRRLLVTASRLEPWKRVDRAIQLVADLSLSGMQDVLLLVIGDGSAMQELQDLTRSLNVESNVRFLGPLPHHDTIGIMKAADVVLSLYDHSNLCNTALEAMRLGRVVVSIDDGSLDELVESWVNGVLVSKANLREELRDVVGRLLREPGLRAQIEREAARTGQERVWSWEQRMAAEVREVERLLSTRRFTGYGDLR